MKNTRKRRSNTCKGYSTKTVISDDGKLELTISRDRETLIEKINHRLQLQLV
ncbi:hypothetical protein [Gilliamella sp. BG1]|uniref:hypothetical protein n=1 Tax=Gilliamella sp. BG1 TaxID=3351508 RepID=UPI0039871111